MKRVLYTAAAAAILLLAGCKGQAPVVPSAPVVPEDCLIDPWTAIDMSDYVIPAPEGYAEITAVTGGTKTHLEADGDSRVSVLWTEGDTFKMLTRTTDNQNYSAYYSTSDSGRQAVFHTNNVMPETSTVFHCMSPTTSKFGYNQQVGLLLGVNVPSEQTAVAGGIEEGLNVSYAYTEDQSSNLYFRNVFSLLRFRLSGSRAATLQSLEFLATDQLAGDFIVTPEDGIPYISGRHFSSDVTSSTITLSGPFSAGVDYYIVLAPGSRPLRLTFTDSDGSSRAVLSSASLNFTRGHVTDIGEIPLAEEFYSGEQQVDTSPELYMEATSGYKPVTLAIVPDGFTEDQLAEYKLLAHSGIDYLFDTEPFKSYKEFFNVWILSVASNESGASVTDGNGHITENHDCYFGSKWGTSSYSDMSLNRNVLDSFVEDNCPDIVNGVVTLAEVPILVIINDDRYGGICYPSPNHGYCMVPYAYHGRRIKYSSMEVVAVSDSDPSAGIREVTDEDYAWMGVNYGDWRNLILHEFGGHCFGRLADEYWFESSYPKVSSISSHFSSNPWALNISANYSPTPWDDDLMSRRDELIAVNPLYARIGSFQGGNLSVLNRWRSEFISCMIDNRAYFSTWQRDLIVRHIFKLAGATFNLEDFLAKDVIFDPVRDGSSSNAPGLYRNGEPCMEGPPLPPPVFSDAL